MKRRGLGRGLDALLGTADRAKNELSAEKSSSQSQQADRHAAEAGDGELRLIAIEQIRPGMYQPRVDMHPEALQELADSIRAQGVVQPIVIRPLTEVSAEQLVKYEIIAGERRWRAAQMAGLGHIPAVIRRASDKNTVAMALIENIQREDLNPVEEASAIKRLIEEFELTHQKAAEAVGRSRTAVTNLLRLLELGQEARTLLENGDLEMGHARALLSLPEALQGQAARQVVSQELSVRDTEKLVKKLLSPRAEKNTATSPDPDIQRLERQLSEKLGAQVSFKHNAKGKGQLLIRYNNLDELEGILQHIQ